MRTSGAKRHLDRRFGLCGLHGAGQAGQADRHKRAGTKNRTARDARSVVQYHGLAAAAEPNAGLRPVLFPWLDQRH